MDPTADHDLVNRVRRGDVNAFGRLVERHQQSVFNVCYRVLRNPKDAEDLTQEAFIRAFEKLDLFDNGRPFGPWVNRIAANLSINTLRNRRILFPLDEDRDQASGSKPQSPESAVEKMQQTENIQTALNDLAPHYRTALELRHFQDMTYEEIAEILQVPLNTAKSYLFRARKILAAKLGKA